MNGKYVFRTIFYSVLFSTFLSAQELSVNEIIQRNEDALGAPKP